MAEVLQREWSLKATLARARIALTEAGVATPDLDARILVGRAIGLDRTGMIMMADRILDEGERVAVAALISRRARGEPVGRILGVREFWDLAFELGPDTLEPRPDTETLVEAALATIDARFSRDAPIRLLDLGSGTGCLLVTLLHELPEAFGIAIDISPGAVEVARRNAELHGVSARCVFAVGSWTEALETPAVARADLIVANPPYIPTAECARLAPEVRDHDPVRALDGGSDGLDAYRQILPNAARLLAPDGVVIVELGLGQATSVARIAEQGGLVVEALRADMAGIERALVARAAAGQVREK
jgi:release factor glutamine methyltransferase